MTSVRATTLAARAEEGVRPEGDRGTILSALEGYAPGHLHLTALDNVKDVTDFALADDLLPALELAKADDVSTFLDLLVPEHRE